MTTENQPRQHNRLQTVLAASAAALCMASCTSGEHSTDIATTEKHVQIIPDMRNYVWRDDNGNVDSTRCLTGGKRACAVQLRTEPKYSKENIINAIPGKNERVDWPLESYDGTKGDSITVRCYEPSGDKMTSSENDLVSTEWYEVEVPKGYWINKAVNPKPLDANTYIGWASVTYFNQTAHEASVPKC